LKQITNTEIAAVVIGRNEGERLVTCLESLLNSLSTIVYVDSGSSDNSLSAAQALGVEIISLDMSIPFTAARARNEGAEYLFNKYSHLKYIQFVDGDCEIQQNWLEKAVGFLASNSKYAIVCGRRRERHPEQSIFNQLCDIEWDTLIGDAQACGGDALIRLTAFQQVAGYNDKLIAGEEPEMCFRMRALDWKIRRIDAEMTLHDAAMTKVSQWWNRAKRAGYAYAEGYYLHGKSAERFKRKQVFSICVWAALLPAMIVIAAVFHCVFLAVFVIYLVQIVRLTIKNRSNVDQLSHAFYYAMSNVFGKFPQFFGMMRFALNKWQGRRGTLIEYK